LKRSGADHRLKSAKKLKAEIFKIFIKTVEIAKIDAILQGLQGC
jgi:hypothetical protein